MPERCWYSLTVRKETTEKLREIAKNRDLTVDEFINELMKPASKGFWSTCAVCGAKVKDGDLARHMVEAHPKVIR
jgi:5-methylcytosine-specific restriction endonuclease McrA